MKHSVYVYTTFMYVYMYSGNGNNEQNACNFLERRTKSKDSVKNL